MKIFQIILSIVSVIGTLLGYIQEYPWLFIPSLIVLSISLAYFIFEAIRLLFSKFKYITLPPPRISGIFVYGSLLDPISIGKTIGRKVSRKEYYPVMLSGYRITWGVPQKRNNMVGKNWKTIPTNTHWLSLILKKDNNDSYAPGAVISLSEEEAKQVKERESNYELRDVSGDIRDKNKGNFENSIKVEKVEAFIARNDQEDLNGHVRTGYYNMVVKALKKSKLMDMKSLEILNTPSKIDANEADDLFYDTWSHEFRKKRLEKHSQNLNTYLRKHGCIRNVSGQPTTPTLNRPLIFTPELFDSIVRIAEDSLAAAMDIINLVVENEDIRDSVMLSEESIELAKAETRQGNHSFPLIARLDLAVSKGGVKVLEINSDSPAGMHHVEILNRWYEQSEIPKELDVWDQNSCLNIVEEISKSLVDRYFQKTGKKIPEGIAIVDCDLKDQPANAEFNAFKNCLEESCPRNCFITICEPQDLILAEESKELFYVGNSEGIRKKIDLIYKRSLYRDLEKDENSKNIWQSYLAGKVLIENNLKARLVGDKSLLIWMSNAELAPKTIKSKIQEKMEQRSLSDHLPSTQYFKEQDELLQQVLRNSEKYVLKSYHGFGAKEVLIPRFSSRNKRQIADDIEECYQKGNYVVQELVNHGTCNYLSTSNQPTKGYFIVGAYLIDGKCKVLEAKVGSHPPISMNKGAKRTLIFKIK